MHFQSLAVLLSYSSAVLATQCYNLLGTLPTDDSFQPCDPDASVSACCANNKTAPDVCIQGGLCYAQEGAFSGFIYGNGCTDSTGEDAACPHVCPAVANGWKYYNVLQCDAEGGKWCCRDSFDDTNCCNNTEMLVYSTSSLLLGQLITTNTSTSTSGNVNATATVTTTATVTAPALSSNSSTVIGASVGAVLGVSLIIAVASLLWMMNKIKNLKKEVQSAKQDTYFKPDSKPTTPARMSQSPHDTPLMEAPAEHASEADWDNQRYELGSK